MKLMRPLFRAAVAALSLAACGFVPAHTAGQKNDAGVTTFDRFKGLAGDWTGTGGTVRFKVSSGGSVVQQIYFPDSEQEMTNMITRDGSDVVLTHYCMVGNQPRMKASDKASGNSVAFTFVSAGNLKSPNSMHMHNVTFTFVDADTIKETWTSWKDGKKAGPDDVFTHKRKK